MTPEARQSYFQMVQAMQMSRNPYSAAAFPGMNPMMYQLIMGSQKKEESIKVQDLMAMFTQGMASTMELMRTQLQTQPQADPIAMVNATVGIMTPFMASAKASDRELLQAQIDAIKSKGSLSEQMGEIRSVMEAFGGGGSTNDYDIQLARLTAKTNWRAMQMTQTAQDRRMEHEAELAKYEQLGAIASTAAAAAAGPGIAQAVSNLAAQQARGAQQPGQPARARARNKKTTEEAKETVKQAIDELVSVDLYLAENLFEEASQYSGTKKIDHELEKAQKYLLKAYNELEKPNCKYDDIVKNLKKSWEHNQKAIKHAEKLEN